MSPLLQNIIVVALVAFALGVVGRQTFSALKGRKSKLGSCCSKGCGSAAPAKSAKPTERIVFMPVEMLSSRKKK
jgi:hypothetical protein